MKQAIIFITIAAALGGAGTLALAKGDPARVEVVEGKDRPLVLGRMVVTAAPLDE